MLCGVQMWYSVINSLTVHGFTTKPAQFVWNEWAAPWLWWDIEFHNCDKINYETGKLETLYQPFWPATKDKEVDRLSSWPEWMLLLLRNSIKGACFSYIHVTLSKPVVHKKLRPLHLFLWTFPHISESLILSPYTASLSLSLWCSF